MLPLRFRGLLGTAVAFMSGLYLPSSEQRHTKALGCVLYSQGFPGRQPASLGWLTEPEIRDTAYFVTLEGQGLAHRGVSLWPSKLAPPGIRGGLLSQGSQGLYRPGWKPLAGPWDIRRGKSGFLCRRGS